ncbi:hypothetical protein BDZ89DRAFT_1059562 [Hymenopellis radicata]|nr:hypothetical protein BDZ89DRAFT_1059562 [Hymenopellis radicata]
MSFFDMFGAHPVAYDGAQQHYEAVYHGGERHHEGSFTHEAIAAAAGFAAMHSYENHLRATGQPVSHGKMKEILAAIAAAEVDKLAETKGMDWMDRRRAKQMAEHHAHEYAAQRYGSGNTGWDYAQQRGGPAMEYNFAGGGMPYYGAVPGYGGYAAPGYPPPGGYGYPPQGGYAQQPPMGYAPPPPQGFYGAPPGEEHHRHHHHHQGW